MSALSWIERLARAGTEHAGSAGDARRVTLVNGLAILTVVLSWASVPAAFLDSKPEALPLNLAVQVHTWWLDAAAQHTSETAA